MISIQQTNMNLDPGIPYSFIHEQEPDVKGELQDVNTIFLTSKRCPYKCIMCDLGINTREENTLPGAIPQQIDYALSRLPQARVMKLYNNGNFFDFKAVPPSDYTEIISRTKTYERIIVENQPKLCGKACLQFNDRLEGKLEVAMGLETIHPKVFPKLNKPFTIKDFSEACTFLKSNGIDIRVFLLLNPPYLTSPKENIEWTLRSIEFAFESGADCCSVIATRPGTSALKKLQKDGLYTLPDLQGLEEVFERALTGYKKRVFVDTWNIDFLSHCSHCFQERKQRLENMNLCQKMQNKVVCSCEDLIKKNGSIK